MHPSNVKGFARIIGKVLVMFLENFMEPLQKKELEKEGFE
jgi:hypothetical protein